jgi:hypothetical protein
VISHGVNYCQVLAVRRPVRTETVRSFEDFPWSAACQSNLGQSDG